MRQRLVRAALIMGALLLFMTTLAVAQPSAEAQTGSTGFACDAPYTEVQVNSNTYRCRYDGSPGELTSTANCPVLLQPAISVTAVEPSTDASGTTFFTACESPSTIRKLPGVTSDEYASQTANVFSYVWALSSITITGPADPTSSAT